MRNRLCVRGSFQLGRLCNEGELRFQHPCTRAKEIRLETS